MKRRMIALILLSLLLTCIAFSASSASNSEIATDYDNLPGVPKGDTDCVAFIRYLANNKSDLLPYFPSNSILYYSQKTDIINSYSPDRGSVAICKSDEYPTYGHVAFVDSVSSDREQITLVEAGGFVSGHVSTRTGSQSDLKIVGYYNPYNVSFYEHHDQEGWVCNKSTETFVQKASNLGFSNDQLSCVVIRQSFITVRLYEHDDYQGRCLVLKGVGVYNLGDSQYNFNDICSSYVITTGD